MSDRFDRVWTILPEYLCGLAWLANIAVFAALMTAPADAAAFARSVATLLGPLDLPDVAVGFLFAVFGVLLPYLIAVIFGPFSFLVLTRLQRAFDLHFKLERLTVAHLKLLTERLEGSTRIPPLPTGIEDLIYLILREARSPLAERLAHRAMRFNVQTYCALPAGVFAGLVTFGLLGQTWWGAVIGLLFAALIGALAVYSAARGLHLYGEDVLLSYLVFSTNAADKTGQPEDAVFEESAP